nr:hypothetical protein [Fredinandcohnia onubensis]
MADNFNLWLIIFVYGQYSISIGRYLKFMDNRVLGGLNGVGGLILPSKGINVCCEEMDNVYS